MRLMQYLKRVDLTWLGIVNIRIHRPSSLKVLTVLRGPVSFRTAGDRDRAHLKD